MALYVILKNSSRSVSSKRCKNVHLCPSFARVFN